MYVLGAFAVVAGGLPLWWAVAAMVIGQALAFAMLTVVAQPGVDYGLPGQVAMRTHLGFWGARLLSSPYRVVAATYWFAAQALTAGLGAQAIYEAMTGDRLPLVPLALAFAVVHATFAVLGFDVMRWLLRGVLPVSRRVHRRSRRSLPLDRQSEVRGEPRLRLARPAPRPGRASRPT